jgi:alpha-beta hydrolase superfamily lysophospholipase
MQTGAMVGEWLAVVVGAVPDVTDGTGAVVVRGTEPSDVADFEPVVDDLAATVAKAVADHPGLPVVVLGHAIGGMIAVRHAQRYPELVTALVLVAPVLGPWMALDQLAEPEIRAGRWSRETLAAIEECLSTIDFDHPLGDDLPALWLHGDDDALVPVADTRAGMDRVRGLRFEERIYPGVGHELPIDVVRADVAEFVGRVVAHSGTPSGDSA